MLISIAGAWLLTAGICCVIWKHFNKVFNNLDAVQWEDIQTSCPENPPE